LPLETAANQGDDRGGAFICTEWYRNVGVTRDSLLEALMASAPMYSISYHKPEKLVQLTWLAGTAGMTDQDFKETLEVFAESSLQHHAERLVIDVREFKHRPSLEILAWRDEVTVGKYNRAGVKRLAWIWPGTTPSNMPTSAKARYENRYCATEEEAVSWVLA
jgi:hypothetical protein